VLGISPFNFPLNLAAHKVAPALAVGAPILLKPRPKTPLSALLLGELLAETDLPDGSWSVLTVPDDRMADLVADPRLPVVSFTGSGPVGWRIKAAVPTKHVTLELGGNAAVLVAADWSTEADLRWAAERIARFANYQAGQSCIAVQRVYVDASLHDRLLEQLVAAVEGCAPATPATRPPTSARASPSSPPSGWTPGCRRPSTPARGCGPAARARARRTPPPS
jgi:aldehyde dehydrogenase (NAD+)/glyceraldehyde-3-phosphate dehydrogenase (NADP+)